MIIFSLDVESVGLRGEGFAAAYVVYEHYDQAWTFLESGIFVCHPDHAWGTGIDREWVNQNVLPAIAEDLAHKNCCANPQEVRRKFWEQWLKWERNGAIMICDCPFPVEFHFIDQCLSQEPPFRQIIPYPMIDVGTLLKSVGKDPTANYERLKHELPVHNPLCDAQQSARLFKDNFHAFK